MTPTGASNPSSHVYAKGQTIVQLGDFGWWPHLSFASDISVTAANADIDVGAVIA